MFLYKLNKTKTPNFEKIYGFKDKILSLDSDELNRYLDNIPSEDEKIMSDIILHYNYPKPLKKSALKLYRYLKPSNLVFCVINLLDVDLTRKQLYSKDSEGTPIRVSASYSPMDNSIVYKKNKDIYHEFIHMSSSSPLRNKRSGFLALDNGIFTDSLNEGYTEVLSRRIFFDGNYDTHSYKFYVDFMLLFECLYDNYKDMESDYFKANYDNLKKVFLRYGTNEEFYNIINILSKECWLLTNDDKFEVLELMKDVIYRTKNLDKIELFNIKTKVKN